VLFRPGSETSDIREQQPSLHLVNSDRRGFQTVSTEIGVLTGRFDSKDPSNAAEWHETEWTTGIRRQPPIESARSCKDSGLATSKDELIITFA
jgi:hypothetical protein